MEMGGRSYNSNDYRFGYTGHEKESDIAEGVYTTQYRLLDTRLGRWMSVDPLFVKYPGMSSYNYCAGNPVNIIDPDGRGFNGGFSITNNTKETIILGGCSGYFMVVNDYLLVEKIDKEKSRETYPYETMLLSDGKTESPIIKLEPGQKLVPYIYEGDNTYYYVAKIFNSDGTLVKIVDAFDVDFIALGEGQTFKIGEQRYNNNNDDTNVKTPVSDFQEGTIKIQSCFGRGGAGKWEELTGLRDDGITTCTTNLVLEQNEKGDDIIIKEGFIDGPTVKLNEPIEHDGNKK